MWCFPLLEKLVTLPVVLDVVGVVTEVGLIGAGPAPPEPPIEIPVALPDELVTLITPLLVIPPEKDDWLTLIPMEWPVVLLTPIVPVLLLMMPLVITEPPVTLMPTGVPPLAKI